MHVTSQVGGSSLDAAAIVESFFCFLKLLLLAEDEGASVSEGLASSLARLIDCRGMRLRIPNGLFRGCRGWTVGETMGSKSVSLFGNRVLNQKLRMSKWGIWGRDHVGTGRERVVPAKTSLTEFTRAEADTRDALSPLV